MLYHISKKQSEIKEEIRYKEIFALNFPLSFMNSVHSVSLPCHCVPVDINPQTPRSNLLFSLLSINLIFYFILITYLVDIVLILQGEILS